MAMNVQFEFPKRDTFLIESDVAAVWEEDGLVENERRLYVITTKVTTGSLATETSVNSGVLAAIVDSHHRCLSVEKHWNSMIDASALSPTSKVNVDLESLWGETAPLPPTAVLSACFSIMPLHNAVITQQDDDSSTTRTKYSLIYPFSLPSMVRGPSHHNTQRQHGSYWESFLAVLHSVCFNDPDYRDDDKASRFTLQSYMDRIPLDATKHGTNNASVWPEELLWKLLNSLVSCLAVYHSFGLHFDGKLTSEDIMCFCAPTSLALAIEDTAVSLKDDPHTSWSEKEKQLFTKTVSNSIALPQAFIVDTTPAACAFFVVSRLPVPVDVTQLGSSDLEAPSPSYHEVHAHAKDLVSVGRIMQDTITLREGRQSVSPELRFLVEKMLACGTESADTAAVRLSASGLCQLQALRLRSALWFSKMEAEEYHVRLTRVQTSTVSPPETATRLNNNMQPDRNLVAREASLARREMQLAEREEKMNTLLELYELTASQLDSLPGSRSSAFNALRHKLGSTVLGSSPSPQKATATSESLVDTSAPLEVSPVARATLRDESALEDSLLPKYVAANDGSGETPVLRVEREGRQRLSGSAFAFSHNPTRTAGLRPSSIYESETTLSSPSLATHVHANRDPANTLATAPAVSATVELTEEEETPEALHTPPRQRLSPAKDARHDWLSSVAGVAEPTVRTFLSVTTGQPHSGGSPSTTAADTHTPTRPTIPSLGKDDLSSQSKYTSIYMGSSSVRAPGTSLLQSAPATTMSSASRHLHFATAGQRQEKTEATPRATSSPSPDGLLEDSAHKPPRQRSNSSAGGGGGGRRSPRVQTDESWIRHQQDTLDELRRSFSTVSQGSATRPSAGFTHNESSIPPPPPPPPHVRGTTGGGASSAGAPIHASPSPLADRSSPLHTPSQRAAPWRTPVSSTTAAQSRSRPGTAPSTTRTVHNPPTVQLSPSGRSSHGSARRPQDGAMDLLQRLRATL